MPIFSGFSAISGPDTARSSRWTCVGLDGLCQEQVSVAVSLAEWSFLTDCTELAVLIRRTFTGKHQPKPDFAVSDLIAPEGCLPGSALRRHQEDRAGPKSSMGPDKACGFVS